MMIRRWFKRLLLFSVLAGLVAVGLYFMFRPSAMGRTEIFKGIYLTALDLPNDEHGHGKALFIEVHWDTPGVQLVHRPYSFEPNPDDPLHPIYRLEMADWALMRDGAAILVNTTRYRPDEIYRSYPGAKVASIETLVVDGQMSHLHPHSYLMFWDKDGNAKFLDQKPPDPESLAKSVLAIGLQGTQVWEGKAHYHSLDDKDLVHPRTFIGFNNEQKTLWLMAYENVSGWKMIDMAIEQGVTFGGMVDSGDGTQLMVGRGAKGVFPHTGIRNFRPVGPYMEIFADPVD
jgi:hypothetical protein